MGFRIAIVASVDCCCFTSGFSMLVLGRVVSMACKECYG